MPAADLFLRKYSKRYRSTGPTDNPKPLSPLQIAAAMNFPTGINLQEMTVVCIELGGGYRDADINQECDSMGVIHPRLEWHGIRNAINNPLPSDADGEVQSDQCVLATLLPGCRLITLFAPNDGLGIRDAFQYSVDNFKDELCVVSLSWGAPEPGWAQSDMDATNVAIQNCINAGIGCYVAAGDSGSTDGIDDGADHVDFPASSPFATGVGGTRLEVDANNKRVLERVWDINDGNGSTGGGFSAIYPALPYQPAGLSKFRIVPDIAGNADPETGYEVEVDFVKNIIGGTSLSTPLMAALHARLQSYFNQRIGDLRRVIYSAREQVCYDVIQGTNGAYSACPGVDPCTGNGVPDGTALLHQLVLTGHIRNNTYGTFGRRIA